MLSATLQSAGAREPRLLPQPIVSGMTRAFLLVTPAGLSRDWLTACIRRLDEQCEIAYALPGATRLRSGQDGAPSLVLIDVDAPRIDRLATVRSFATQVPDSPVVVLGSATDADSIDEVLRAGAVAYIPRLYTESQMLSVLRLALEGAGHRPHFPGQRAFAQEEAGAEPPAAMESAEPEATGRSRQLTPKQVEVLSLAADGLSNKQIAARLNITEGTVKLHMSAIYSKLNVDRRGEAIVLARRLEEVRAQQMRQAERGAQVLDWLLPHVAHRRFGKGDVIFRKDDPGRELYYIQRGTVVLEEIGVEMGPRDIFGEIGVFAPDHQRTCTARCKTDVDLFCLNSEQVKSIYYLNPQFALHVVHLVAQRLLADRTRTH
jgi:two-component system nitrate/nitrite response regulator NarL